MYDVVLAAREQNKQHTSKKALPLIATLGKLYHGCYLVQISSLTMVLTFV
jgi:hypothetical protein